MKRLLLIFVFLSALQFLFAQEKVTISGYIKEAATGEELIGASIFVPELRAGGITNVYGFYSITIPKGNYTLIYSFIGFEDQKLEINLSQNLRKDIELKESSLSLQEVVITGETEDRNIKSSEMSAIKMDMKEIKSLPVLFGEQDIIKTLQLLPGVKSAGEGGSGFYVRGGSADQNLILLDEAPIYNASHLLGFFSVFNSDALKDVKMIKGGMPAEYGGRLSSVLDIKMKDGNSKRLSVSGGLGLISSRLTVEGPLVKNKGSFIISGRRTYADLFLKLSSDDQLNKTKLYFYDLNMKANYRLGNNDRIFISGYFGKDVFGFEDVMSSDWGNTTATVRWNHLFSEKLFLNSSFIFSDYTFDSGMTMGESMTVNVLSGVKDFNLKEDFQYYINTNSKLKFGANIIHHTFKPGEVSSNSEQFSQLGTENDYAYESAAYIANEFKVGGLLTFNLGLRYSNFAATGPGDVYSYEDNGNVKDTASYSNNELIKDYGGLEPRFSMSYILDEKSSVKLSYARNRQYIHFLSNSTSGAPLDAWVPSSTIIQPEISDQIALGYFRNFSNNKFETSVELYYKNMQNQVDYKNGADLFLNPMVESQLVFGSGRSYGLEMYLKKKVGKLTGWISYTLSRAERQISDINGGDWYPVKYDRTHDISVVGMYKLNDKWSFSASWVYNTGDAVTFPSGKYVIEDQIVNMYTERNGYRMPDYHRLDLGATYTNKKRKKYESSWNFSIYNAYARENAYTITFQEKEGSPNEMEATQLSLFKIIPSITYNFKF